MDSKMIQFMSPQQSAFSALGADHLSNIIFPRISVDEDTNTSENSSKEGSESGFELSNGMKNGLFTEQPPPIYNFASKISANSSKRVYFCQRCLNHGRHEPRKNHKCDCPYANCICEKCILVEKRRHLNSQLHDLEDVMESPEDHTDVENHMNGGKMKEKGERVPNCQKCGQHGRKNRLKGHKRVCPFKDCVCAKCQVVSERQKLMADQIKIRRRQRKDTLMNLTRENITATINAAAAVAAGQMNFANLNFGNLNAALLYSQMKNQLPPGLISSPSHSSESSTYSPPASMNSLLSSHSSDLSSILFNATNSVNGISSSTLPQSPDAYPPSIPLPTPTPIQMNTTVVPPQTPSPMLPNTAGILAPVAINPTTVPTSSAFQFPLITSSEQLLQLQALLANYKLLSEQQNPLEDVVMTSLPSDTVQTTNGIIDVCSV